MSRGRYRRVPVRKEVRGFLIGLDGEGCMPPHSFATRAASEKRRWNSRRERCLAQVEYDFKQDEVLFYEPGIAP